MDKREAQGISDNIVKALVEIRKAKKVTPYRLAKDTGLAPSTISYLERHKLKPTMYLMVIIADYLGVDLGEIISKVMKN